MKKLNLIYLLILSAVVFTSCDNVNSLHDVYLSNGEDLLVGKVDSFDIYGGKKRAKFVVWVGDYRAKKLIINRNDSSLTYEFDLDQSNRKDSMVFYIDNLKEGTNILNWKTWNNDGTVSSIPSTTSVTTWGERYESFLTNRRIVSSRFNLLTKAFTITWDPGNVVEPTFGRYAIGHDVKYRTVAGNDSILRTIFDSDKLATPPTITVLRNFPTSNGAFSYRMLYVPDKTSIDTFLTTYQTITAN